MIHRRNVASQTDVLVGNVFETPATLTEIRDMETQTIVESNVASTVTSSVNTSSPIRQNFSESRKRPWSLRAWTIRDGRRRDPTFSLDAVRVRHEDLYSIRMNPTKFRKIFGPSLGNPAVDAAYIKVWILHGFLKQYR